MTRVSVLEISTVAACPVRCRLCPQDVLKAAYPKGTSHRLSLDDFRTALKTVPTHVRIHFSGFVEPWTNPDCTEMLAHALNAGYRLGVYTTCVGMGLNWYRLAELLIKFRDRVDVVCVHLSDALGNMSVASTEAPHFIVALQEGGLTPEVMRMDPSTGFVQIDRAGNLPSSSLVRRSGSIKCSYTDDYSHNVMLPNGDVHLCCMDYGLKHKLGNLLIQSWEDIMHGKPLQDLRESNGGQDGTSLCRKCHGACRS